MLWDTDSTHLPVLLPAAQLMDSCWHGLPLCKGKQLRDAGWRDWGAWEERKHPFRLGVAEGRAAPAKPEAQVLEQGSLGSHKAEQSFSFQGAGGMKDAGSAPPALSRRHRRMKGACRSPRTRPCPLQFSVQYELGVPTVSSALSQLQGTGLKMLLELPGMKLDPEGSREQELRSNHSQEQREQLGWDLQSPGRGKRDKICIGFLTGQRPCASLWYRKQALLLLVLDRNGGVQWPGLALG